MKKVLIATTALVATAGMAAAEVTVSGLGRFGVNYSEGADDTTIGGRLRFNIDGSTETDGGVTFGGRIRIQNDWGHGVRGYAGTTNQAMMFASFGGARLEVGNTNTAIDSAGLFYASEIGYDFSISGNGIGGFFAYSSSPLASTPDDHIDYMGLFFSYTVGDFTGRISYVDPDQTGANGLTDDEEEVSVSLDYATGPFTLSLGAWKDGAGVADNDGYFVGGQYDFAPAYAGLLFYDEDGAGVGGADATTITLYGGYTMGATTIKGFVSSSDDRGTEDFAVGIGADYDLGGGTTLAGAIGQDWAGDTQANLGVRFSF